MMGEVGGTSPGRKRATLPSNQVTLRHCRVQFWIFDSFDEFKNTCFEHTQGFLILSFEWANALDLGSIWKLEADGKIIGGGNIS